ncbi:MAG: hypothetical protein ACJ786_38460 [Catenulispora sp.]
MTNSGPEWHLQPGETILRKELHDHYGGQRRFGIAPCLASANILLFTASRAWPDYDNGWSDGTFLYTGQARAGKEIFDGWNAYIRDHVKLGKALRLFEGTGGKVRYIGEFVLDDVNRYHFYDGHDRDGDAVRMVKFHLVRAARSVPVAITDVPVGIPYRRADEDVHLAAIFAEPADPQLIERNLTAHRRLQNELAEAVRRAGWEPLSPSGTDCDFDLAWRRTDGSFAVCEVKSLTDANETRQLRTGIGQLLDYLDQFRARNLEAQGVLWIEREPAQPRWIKLAHRVRIQLAWPGRESSVLG